MSFYSANFIFDDISNTDMGVILVNMESDVLMEYGIKYKENLQVEMSNNNYFYYSQNSEIDTINLTLALVDEHQHPKIWTLEDRKKIIDWIVTKEFVPFISEDDKSVIYYLKCVEYTKKFNSVGQGVIEFIMQPESQYAYTPILNYTYSINEEREFEINCLDNVNEKYHPTMEIIQFDKNQKDVIIYNETLQLEPFIIKNLKENERVVIDHLLKSINSNIEMYKLKDINRKWIYFKKGINKIKVNGNCIIKITVQFPIKV